MIVDDEFMDLTDNQDQFKEHKVRQKRGVIKKARNQVKGTVHLEPLDEESGDGVEFFQPIYEGETVVGVIHKCSCGRASELRFQYSDQ